MPNRTLSGAETGARSSGPDWPALASLAVLAAGNLAAYGRTLTVPLLLDDRLSIAKNATIRHLWPLGPVFHPPNAAGVGGRPLLNLSYALNYRLGGLDLAGYHVANLAIHTLAAWTLFALVRHTLRLLGFQDRIRAASTGLALAVSALWAWHPVQTESVTYLSQRAESLMGLFYLLTLYCFLRGAESTGKAGRTTFFSLAAVACLAGVGTKEVIVTAPLLVFCYDRTFLSGTFRAAWRRHRAVHLALAATWLPLGWLMIGLSRRAVGFGQGITSWAYALTECRAVLKYLQLSVWPRPLIFDYGTDLAVSPAVACAAAAGLILLLMAAATAAVRCRTAGFAACWFFLLLAPSSSIIPIVGQPIAENRLYLPLAGVLALIVVGAFAWMGRASLALFALLGAGSILASAERNRDYSSELHLWQDTAAKNPTSTRAYINQSALLADEGRLEEAAADDKIALRLNPNDAEAHNNLGHVEERLPGRLNDAIGEFATAARLKPDFFAAHYNLGISLERSPGRAEEAIAQYRAAIRIDPDYAAAHISLGNALLAQGRTPAAIAEFEAAIRIAPDNEPARYNLGNALKKLPGREADAIGEYEIALRLNPDDAQAHNNLGNALRSTGRTREAIAHYREALRLEPDFTAARMNLANALAP